ncbi:hypothetical protein Droror1_Dr00020097 [Drosera rotundifolia]
MDSTQNSESKRVKREPTNPDPFDTLCGDVSGGGDDERKKRGGGGGGGAKRGGGNVTVGCQAERCEADLTEAKRYHRRHKVCEFHAKAPVVVVAGLRQRFCQQCSRFHELEEFDETKRSCRRRLAGHNERRRKGSTEPQGEGSSRKASDPQVKENQCRPADHDSRGRVPMALPANSAYKQEQYQIR